MARTTTAILLTFLLAAPAAAADGVMRRSFDETPARAATQAAARQAGGAHAPSRPAGGLNTIGTAFLLPFYEVDTAGALTTLLAARNAFDVPNTIDVTYFDRAGAMVHAETFDVAPLGVVTRNLRDVAALPAETDGVRRGFALIEADQPLSGDFFRVDPAQNFAAGDRLVLAAEALCDLWDFRFLRGGGFSGGTDLVLYVDTPLGLDLASTPSITVVAYDEAGNELGAVDFWTQDVVNEMTAADVLEVLDEPLVNAGVFDVFFNDGTGGGLVYGTYSAEGRYSIGMHGTCY